ncbi:unnamed protein product [Protopolystoma xenopodis]|uniref:Uncharacterized protein n=1 Tax=Protopolystoma xenopodis TaxID=117903 RepID=A0A3S5AC20_9PLAT|nr:unnamed protein product [Protopolystoma xenopodis]
MINFAVSYAAPSIGQVSRLTGPTGKRSEDGQSFSSDCPSSSYLINSSLSACCPGLCYDTDQRTRELSRLHFPISPPPSSSSQTSFDLPTGHAQCSGREEAARVTWHKSPGGWPFYCSIVAYDPISRIALVTSSNFTNMQGHHVCRVVVASDKSETRQADWISLEQVAFLRSHVSVASAQPTNLRALQPPMLVHYDIPTISSTSEACHSLNGYARLFGLLFLPHSKPSSLFEIPSETQIPSTTSLIEDEHCKIQFMDLNFSSHEQKFYSYPTVHIIYGGPGVQMVSGTFSKVIILNIGSVVSFMYTNISGEKAVSALLEILEPEEDILEAERITTDQPDNKDHIFYI